MPASPADGKRQGGAGSPEVEGPAAPRAASSGGPPRQQFSPYFTFFLICLMLLTGTCNTILTKTQDRQCLEDCDGPEPKLYEQPVWQTINMFCGEFCCMIAVYVGKLVSALRKKTAGAPTGYESLGHDNETDDAGAPSRSPQGGRVSGEVVVDEDIEPAVGYDESHTHHQKGRTLDGWKRLLLWIPTLCDICATTLMNVGLILISASVYQMLRGGVVFFTGLFSSVFLRRRFELFQWAALVFVMLGVAVVGASPLIESSGAGVPGADDVGPSSTLGHFQRAIYAGTGVRLFSGDVKILGVDKDLVGVGMVLLAQIFTATQFILEEKIMAGYHLHPLMAVGLEGTFGLLTVGTVLPILDRIITPGNPGTFFDIRRGFYDTFLASPVVFWAGMGCVLSIALFNWCGLEVTRRVSATSRSTVDTCRTILIWAVSLTLGWEHFRGTQVLGFCVLLYGTMTFNGVIRPLPFLRPRPEPGSQPPTRSPSFTRTGPAEESSL